MDKQIRLDHSKLLGFSLARKYEGASPSGDFAKSLEAKVGEKVRVPGPGLDAKVGAKPRDWFCK